MHAQYNTLVAVEFVTARRCNAFRRSGLASDCRA
jgi:hypothetical protein